METYLFWDCETTGLTPGVHGILTAYLVEVGVLNGKIRVKEEHELDLSIKYTEMDMPKIDATAMKINKINLDTFVGKYTPIEAVRAIIELKERISPIKRLKTGGHNVSFDNNHMRVLFASVGQDYDSYFHYETYDSKEAAVFLRNAGVLSPENLRLIDLRTHFNIDMSDVGGEAHEAKYDVYQSIRVMECMNEIVTALDI